MKDRILQHIDHPRELEKLYRQDKNVFRKEFNLLYPELKGNRTAEVWHERLNYENEAISWGGRNELLLVVALSLVAGLIAKIPELTGIKEDHFYPRNISFILFPVLIAYFINRNALPVKKVATLFVMVLIACIYINVLPGKFNSDTLMLACIHLPLMMWMFLGWSFTGNEWKNPVRRIAFLRYNGDLLVMTAVILIAGALLTGITLGLFRLIEMDIAEFYFRYVVVFGLSAAPVVGTYLVQTNPSLVSRVSPAIARIFTPLVLLMLLIYLPAVIVSGKDPYNDREFLLLFNALLIGVMAIILFSVSAMPKGRKIRTGLYLLLALSAATILVNGIALSAIVFRISEWGITPNRLAVLGGNVLILIHLIMVSSSMLKALNHDTSTERIEKSISDFLPVYGAWTFVVTFVFPFLFGFA